MGQAYHIARINIVNEGEVKTGEVFIKDAIISKINFNTSSETPAGYKYINGEGLHLFPGVIDDHVHFREPGLTELADIHSESHAAVAGGVTSFMDMPNTIPNVITQEILEQKYDLAAKSSIANYSFYMGSNNTNYDEVMRTPLNKVCGIKMFLASSTGNLIIDQDSAIENIFKSTAHLIAVHCEDENSIKRNLKHYKDQKDIKLDVSYHSKIRNAESCFISSKFAIQLAKKHNCRLHILHVSSKKELSLFNSDIPLEKKQITTEACIHHLWFTDNFYIEKANFIKVNPAIKGTDDRFALRNAVKSGKIDVVATDHAPHLIKNKMKSYLEAPSGAPMIQHSLQAMISLSVSGLWTLTDIAKYMSHNPATIFKIKKRGFIREGYYADLVILNLNTSYKVDSDNILYKCHWSPLQDISFGSEIKKTFVNGNLVYEDNNFVSKEKGMRLEFERD